MSLIVRVENAGPTRRARRLVLEDGGSILTSAAVVRALGIEPGTDCDEAMVDAIRAEEPGLAKDRALFLLGYRDRSVAELSGKLAYDGYPSDVVERVVSAIVFAGYVDDARYAINWVRCRTRAGYGPRRITNELQRKGLSDAVIDDAFLNLENYDAVASARSLIKADISSDRRSRERALRRMLSRGFDMSTALSALGDGSTVDD